MHIKYIDYNSSAVYWIHVINNEAILSCRSIQLAGRRELFQIKYRLLLYLEENPEITAYQIMKYFHISSPPLFRKIIDDLIYKKYVIYSDKALKGKNERAKTYYLSPTGVVFLEDTREKFDIFFDIMKPH